MNWIERALFVSANSTENAIYSTLLPSISERQKKKWGYEYILPTDGRYTTKIMEIFPGAACSMHFHGEKSESFILITGVLNVELISKEGVTNCYKLEQPLSTVAISKLSPHSFSVPEDQEFNTIFIEASTPDKAEDSYRFTKSRAPKGENN